MHFTLRSPLRWLRRVPLAITKGMGYVQGWLLLTLCYVVVLSPVAIVFKLVADPLGLWKRTARGWHGRSEPTNPWIWSKAQF